MNCLGWEESWTFGDTDEECLSGAFTRPAPTVLTRPSAVRSLVSVCVYHLHAFPSAHGFIPCSLSGLHFYGPRTFFSPSKRTGMLWIAWTLRD